MHLSDKAVLVHLGVSQWVAKKLDRKASNEIARINGADNRAGNYNKSLLPSCTLLEAVKQETSAIRKDFYRNTLPWGIEGTFILPSANYLAFMSEYRGKKGYWKEVLVKNFLDGYLDAKLDAQRLLGSLYNESNYPTLDSLTLKFDMDLSVMPVPVGGDFRADLSDDEAAKAEADLDQLVLEATSSAVRETWDRLFEQVEWIRGRLADPKTTFHDETYINAQELVKMLGRLNLMDDPNLEAMRKEAEDGLFKLHPQALRNDPTVRQDTADEAKAIMEKMKAFMGGLA